MTHEATLAVSTRALAAREGHVEALLDDALAATFPASDPVALTLGGALAVAATARFPPRSGERYPRRADRIS
jgi:hypothetical protein